MRVLVGKWGRFGLRLHWQLTEGGRKYRSIVSNLLAVFIAFGEGYEWTNRVRTSRLSRLPLERLEHTPCCRVLLIVFSKVYYTLALTGTYHPDVSSSCVVFPTFSDIPPLSLGIVVRVQPLRTFASFAPHSIYFGLCIPLSFVLDLEMIMISQLPGMLRRGITMTFFFSFLLTPP